MSHQHDSACIDSCNEAISQPFVDHVSASIVHMTCPCDCRHEYGEAELTLELVSSMDEAIDHLHAHGSGHTECIITGESLHLHTQMHHAHTAH